MSRTLQTALLTGLVATGFAGGCSNAKTPTNSPTPKAETVRPLNPNEFKLVVTYYDVNKEESITSTLIFREDRVFQFIGVSPEFIVIDLNDGKTHLADVKKAASCEIKAEQIETSYNKKIQDRREEAEKTAKQDKPGDHKNAKIEINLLDPQFTAQDEPSASGRFRLKSPAVDVSFTGEAAPGRLDVVHQILTLLIKLRSNRFDDAIPPQAHLFVLKQLKEKHKLRPTELVFLFRLTNTPEKYRWTYELFPTLTSREWEATRRIDNLLQTTRSVPFARFERIIAYGKLDEGVRKPTQD